MESNIPTVTNDEPAQGWQRVEICGEKPYFKSPVPRTIIRDRVKLKEFLNKEHIAGRMRDVHENMFSFKRKLGLKRKGKEAPPGAQAINRYQEDKPTTSIVDRLTKNWEVIDHQKLLLDSCKELDQLKICDLFKTPDSFEDVKSRIASSTDLMSFSESIFLET